jgi:hypothetical protein
MYHLKKEKNAFDISRKYGLNFYSNQLGFDYDEGKISKPVN